MIEKLSTKIFKFTMDGGGDREVDEIWKEIDAYGDCWMFVLGISAPR